MSYEPDTHAAQMEVLRHLLMNPRAKFSTLRKEAAMQSDQFTFHLKKLIKVGYVAKQDDEYYLTRTGKEYANRMDVTERSIEKQAKLSVVLLIERDDGMWLHQQRLKHPYYGYWGHPTGKVRWGETLLGAGERELKKETGLEADLRIVGIFHKLDYTETGELLEDKLLCLIHGRNPRGIFITDPEGHYNKWMTFEDYERKDKKFGSVAESITFAHKPGQFVVEHEYRYAAGDY